jgi:hypothetical protein
MKRLLLLPLLVSLNAFGALSPLDDSREFQELMREPQEDMLLAVSSEKIVSRNIKEPVNVLHDKDGFTVVHNAQFTRVKEYDVVPELRKMDLEKAAKVLSATQLRVSRLNNGEFTIARHGELKGGGAGGATFGFWLGKAGTYVVGHGIILLASGLTGWNAPATFLSLEAKLAVPIEVASNKVALGLGATMMVATGPV